jgi:hypothetical protein
MKAAAISNRLIGVDKASVTFKYKDCRIEGLAATRP